MSKKKLFLILFSTLVILATLLSACGGKKTGTEGVTTDAKATVEIWIDAAREESAGKFIDKFPDKGKLVTLTTTDYGQLPQKILFWNNVGGGWPDASFGVPQIVPLINDASHSYLGDLAPFVKKEIINGFAPGALQSCWDGEKLYCMRNDLAFFVLYYNAPLIKQYGYTIPTTYEELMALGVKVKAEHPDVTYFLTPGSVGTMHMMVSAKCPFQQQLGPGKIRVNAVHENCKKAAQYMDEMTAKGIFSAANMWAEETSNIIKSGKWLFIGSSSWFGDYVIKGTYFAADDPNFVGMIGVAPMPKWDGQDHPWVYWWGGAAWVMSRHTKNPQLTADFLTFMTTDEIKNQGTYPAYMPAAEEWLKNRMPTLTYFEDPTKAGQVFKAEASHMWTMAAEGPVDATALWSTVQAKVDAKEIAGYVAALEEFQKLMLDGAGKLGYEPVTDGLDDFK